MMSLYEIQRMSAEAGARAAMRHTQPTFFWDQDIHHAKLQIEAGFRPVALLRIPFLGDHVPQGYEREEELFVDSSGFGREGELAMTIKQFVDQLRTDVGYGITASGQFQVYIGVYKKVGGES